MLWSRVWFFCTGCILSQLSVSCVMLRQIPIICLCCMSHLPRMPIGEGFEIAPILGPYRGILGHFSHFGCSLGQNTPNRPYPRPWQNHHHPVILYGRPRCIHPKLIFGTILHTDHRTTIHTREYTRIITPYDTNQTQCKKLYNRICIHT